MNDTPQASDAERAREAASAWSDILAGMKRFGMESSAIETVDDFFAALRDRPTEGGVSMWVRETVEFAGDIRWQELAQGSPFTVIDRELLGSLHYKATAALAPLQAGEAVDVRPRNTSGVAVSETASGSQQAGEAAPVVEGNDVRLAREEADNLERVAEEADENGWLDWGASMRQAAERLRALSTTPAKPAQTAQGVQLERWGFQWKGHDHGTHAPMADGYWTPWHIAQAAIEALSTAPHSEERES